MTGAWASGFLLILLAGTLQGTFVLPMTLTRRWAWEHSWFAFSLLGMLGFNWLLAALTLPSLAEVFQAVPAANLAALAAFGGLWGVGAVLFGLGMDRLGMALGYPVIMGLILSLGAWIPLLLGSPAGVFSPMGGMLALGTAVTVGGIVLCSRAAGIKDGAQPAADSRRRLTVGLVIAIFAGMLSCLPNVGMNHATGLRAAAVAHGASESLAGNAAWALLFTAGFMVNAAYCGWLLIRRRTLAAFAHETARNFALIALMALLWIGSFYLYGLGAAQMGKWGGIIGWPIFIALAILVGNLWGLWRGEWKAAPAPARKRLHVGLAVLIASVALFGLSSALKP
jgi:L-rhamnose-H+ transport protein